MEYDYREYRKDSQAVLREKNSRREKMDHFLSSEERKKEGREPEKKLEIGNSYGTFEIGFSKAAAKKNREDVQKAPEKERSSTETGSVKNGNQADRESFCDEESGKA